MTSTAQPILRPRGLGELLDQAVRLYRRHFLTFVGVIALVQVPIALLQLGASLLTLRSTSSLLSGNVPADPMEVFNSSFIAGQAGTILVSILGFVLVQGVGTAAMTRAVADSYLGQPAGILDAYRRIGRAWRPLIGALLLAALWGLGLLLWFVVPCVGWVTGAGILLFFAMVIVPLIAPIVVLERQAARRAVRRAWDLARRRFWWALGFVFLLYLFNLLIVSGPVALITSIFQFLLFDSLQTGEAAGLLTLQAVVSSLVGLVLSLIYLPLQLIGITLMYFDLRVRTEGFDLALLAEQASGRETPVAEITARAPEPQGVRLVTWREMGYFALLSAAGLILYGGLIAALALLAVPAFLANGFPS